MAAPCSIGQYLQAYGNVLGDRVLAQFPPLHNPTDSVFNPELRQPQNVIVDLFEYPELLKSFFVDASQHSDSKQKHIV